MFQNAKFYLIKDVSLEVTAAANPQIQHDCEISPVHSDDDDVNIRACKHLKRRVIGKLAPENWGLQMEIKDLNSSPPNTESRTRTTVHPNHVTLSGEILKQIHSTMLYGMENARLKIKMSMDINIETQGRDPNGHDQWGRPSSVSTTSMVACVNYRTDLFPHVENGRYDHSIYSSIQNNGLPAGPQISVSAQADGRYNNFSRPFTLKLSNVSVWVDGIENEHDSKHAPDSNIFDEQKKLLKTGLFADMKIICKENEEIPCLKVLLISKSPVLEAMLQEKVYTEGESREIPMADWSKEEVMAFLAFLYFGGMTEPLKDTLLAVTLYEMSHYYNVANLEKALKSVLVTRPAESFAVDAALRLFNMAYGSGDSELKQKAADVLDIKSDEDIFASPLFKTFSAEVARELFVLSRQKF